jgi:glycosyltransferase involved in cell wall biosynthesis
MKIALVAPLYERVPPLLYGGTERIVSYLTEELVAQGHDVTLFASGDSVTRAELIPCCDEALRLSKTLVEPLAYHMMMLERVRRRQHEFDLVHFNIDLIQFPLLPAFEAATLTTLHGRLDLPDLLPFYRLFDEEPLVSISNDQRRPMPPVNWAGTVYHGLPPALPFRPEARGGYLAFLGRISPEKRPDLAIDIALRSGVPLKIAAKVDKADYAYWKELIEPLVKQHSDIEFIGEIGEAEKADFLGDALAFLFPIDWPEPFGLSMIEAMSCGTPVIAFRRGSVPEIVDHGVSGLIVNGVDQAVAAVEQIAEIDRAGVRSRFEERFTVGRMASDYVDIYRRLMDKTDETAPCEPEPEEIELSAVA